MSEITMNIHEILEHLPHRYPFILVDKVTHLELGKEITAIKNVTINEPFFPKLLNKYYVRRTSGNRKIGTGSKKTERY